MKLHPIDRLQQICASAVHAPAEGWARRPRLACPHLL